MKRISGDWKRRIMAHTMAPLAVMVASSAGCGDVTGPIPDGPVRIEVAVSGGFAGVSYSFELDGPDGVVRGLSCTSQCDFEAMDVLMPVSPYQVGGVARQMRAAHILDLDGTDFGTQCCDQFSYVITYEEGDRRAVVRGDSGTLPDDLIQAVARLQAMADGRLAMVVALGEGAESLPTDPLTVGVLGLSGDLLEVEVSYGGGCAAHEIDLVAFGGWLESTPVQVEVLLSHEANDDPCEAYLTETRRFHLRPLAEAYQESYGVGEPGETTVVLRIQDPDSSSTVHRVEYRF